jgi:hypothetical protein
MRTPISLFALLAAVPVFAGEPPAPTVETPAPSNWTFSAEATTGYSYVTGGRTDGKRIDEQASEGEFVLTSQYNQGAPIRLGLSWQRFSFSATEGTRLPNTLQSVAVVAGIDAQVGESIFLRLEAQPGWYSGSNRIVADSFNIPIVFGGSYLISKDLQIMLGIEIDPQRNPVVLPGGGFRWQATDSLLFDLVLPKPRVEYKMNNDLTLFVGGDLFEASYRVDSDLGNRVGTPKLNHAWLDYFEVRVGAGATYKATEDIDLDFELGYMAYRAADYDRPDILVHSDTGGLYGGVTLHAKF